MAEHFKRDTSDGNATDRITRRERRQAKRDAASV
jgi:hypothetical protein